MIKLPSEYPPELPMTISMGLHSILSESMPDAVTLLGSCLSEDIVKGLISKYSDSGFSKEYSEIGFHVFRGLNEKRHLVYSPMGSGTHDVHENMSLALHVLCYLNFKTVTIIDGVQSIEENPPVVYSMIDYINLSGINPLDYWMMLNEPERFFLDVKNLFLIDNRKNLKKTIHLCVSESDIQKNVQDAKYGNALTYGPAFCPESIVAGYLGMKVRAYGVVQPSTGDNEKLEELIFSLLNF